MYVDVPFPDRIAFGALSEPVWRTLVAESEGGFEETDEAWSNCKHAYDASLAVRTGADYLLVRAHFHEARGRANSFPFKDYLDYTVAAASGYLLDPDDLSAVAGNGTYQLFKRYGSTNPYNRKITRPVATIQVLRTRSGSTTDISGTDATVTYSTGAVVITGHASGDTYAWAGEFRVPCRYDIDRLPTAIVNKQGNGELLVSCQAIPIVEVRE